MTDLRTAAQQALEAMDALDASPSGVVDHYELERRKQALRDALAQQEQEPVAVHQFRKQYCANWYDGHPDHTDGGGPYEERTLYTARPAALAQQAEPKGGGNLPPPLQAEPVQEPVARPTVDEFAQHIRWINGGHKMGAGVLAESLLEWLQSKAALPRREWRGLTEKEIQSIHDTYHKRMGPQEFARAIEQALKEKNHG